MARRRRRGFSVDGLLATLADLDKQRHVITEQIKARLNTALSGVSAPFSLASPATRRGRPPGSKNVAIKGTRKRRKMSAAARKRISDAQKKRWAAQKAAKR